MCPPNPNPNRYFPHVSAQSDAAPDNSGVSGTPDTSGHRPADGLGPSGIGEGLLTGGIDTRGVDIGVIPQVLISTNPNPNRQNRGHPAGIARPWAC